MALRRPTVEVRDHPTGLSGAYGASPLISGRLRGSRVEISKEKSNAFFGVPEEFKS